MWYGREPGSNSSLPSFHIYSCGNHNGSSQKARVAKNGQKNCPPRTRIVFFWALEHVRDIVPLLNRTCSLPTLQIRSRHNRGNLWYLQEIRDSISSETDLWSLFAFLAATKDVSRLAVYTIYRSQKDFQISITCTSMGTIKLICFIKNRFLYISNA